MPAIILAFVFFTITGTITHEYGHIAAAKLFGVQTKLHYGWMSHSESKNAKGLKTSYSQYSHEIENNLPFAKQKEFEKIRLNARKENLWITAGGPIETILTAISGLIILFIRRNRIRRLGIKLIYWFAIFLSLFWLREVFNLVVTVSSGIITGNNRFFGGDEARLSLMLKLAVGTIPVILFLAGILVSAFIVLRIVPKEKRFTFILGGSTGGISGYVLWMGILGPIILP